MPVGCVNIQTSYKFYLFIIGCFVLNGAQFGTVLTMPIAGFLSASKLGWPSVFYLLGFLGIAWGILFYCMGFDTPSEHPTINPIEKEFINNSLGNLNRISNEPKNVYLYLLLLK